MFGSIWEGLSMASLQAILARVGRDCLDYELRYGYGFG